MNPFKRSPRRGRKVQLGPEPLESRELLTGGAGNMFAEIPGTVTSKGGTTDVSFTIDPAEFSLPKGKMVLGVDVAAASGSTIKPFIQSVSYPGNQGIIPQAFHSIYAPHLLHSQVANGAGTSAVLTPIQLYPKQPNKPVTYTVQVTGESNTSGDFLVGFYLPGDANGDGSVDKTDLALVKASQGVEASSSKYNFAADANRDGRIGKIDIAATLQNQGVKLTVTPVVIATLDAASVTDPATRSTTTSTAHFTGTATPNGTITFTNTSDPTATPVTTTVDSTGNYSITVPLSLGPNVFQVEAKDSFGQDIKGTISAVTRNLPATT